MIYLLAACGGLLTQWSRLSTGQAIAAAAVIIAVIVTIAWFFVTLARD